MQLIQYLNKDWEEEKRISTFLTSINQVNTTLDSLYIFTTSFYKANSIDSNDFVISTQLDVEELETYERAMSCFHAQKWFYAIQKDIDQLKKNKTRELILMSEIEDGHKPLRGKWVFKVKRNVNDDIARFKVYWVVHKYL